MSYIMYCYFWYITSCWRYIVIDTACIVCGAGSMKWLSIHLSLHLTATAASLLLSAHGQEILISSGCPAGVVLQHGVQQQMRAVSC